MEVKYKMVPVEPTDEMLTATGYWDCKSDVQHYELSKAYRSMVEAAPDQLSDLEIVQKALSKTGYVIWMNYKNFSVCDDSLGEVVIEFKSFESLLTWAKQTIGVE